jgi:heme-degrading monooxygenase HmoA
MIVRLWRGRARGQRAGAYEAHVVGTVFPKLAQIPGFAGGRVLRRDVDDEVEFLVLTEWTSWKAITAFAGSNPDVAVIEPEARAVLSAMDERVQHFAVAYESRA